MRIIFCGDSPTVSTGFSRCSRALCDELYSRGHEVHAIGINAIGDPHDFPYDIWMPRNPHEKCFDLWGTSRLCTLIDKLRPDVCCILQDPWNIKSYFDELDRYFKEAPQLVPPIVGWLAVDSENMLSKPVNRLSHVVAWTDFGADELRKGGYEGPLTVAPLGVDHGEFYPHDRQAARQELKLNDDAFIVLAVSRNQGRKRLDLTIEAFHRWITDYDIPNGELLIHSAPTGETGCNIRALVHYYKLHGRVIISEPHIGKGVDNLATLYSACDVYLSTSQAEGWLLPALEAQACGLPVVVSDFAATGPKGWIGDSAIRVPARNHALTAPMNSLAYTIGATPRVEDVADALNRLYANHPCYGWYRRAGLAHASKFSWQSTGRQVADVLEKVALEAQNRAVIADSSLVLDSSESEPLEPSEFAAAV